MKEVEEKEIEATECDFQLTDKEKCWIEIVKSNKALEIDLNDQVILFPIERIVKSQIAKNKEKEIFVTVEKYFKLYKQIDFSNVLNKEFKIEKELMHAWPMFSYGFDKYGHPVTYDEICADYKSFDKIRKVLNGKDLSSILLYRFRFGRRVANIKLQQTKKLNKCIFKHIAIVDCAQFSIGKHFSSEIRNILQAIIEQEQILYVENVQSVYLINTPWIFRTAWQILSTFIDPRTCAKTKVLGYDYLKELVKEIDIDQIPPKYGGTGTKPIVLGQ